MTRTFLDTGVLILGYRGTEAVRRRVLELIGDTQRTFVSSPFLELELLPKAEHFNRADEVSFYEDYCFRIAEPSSADLDLIVAEARTLAVQHGLAAMDALHAAVARLAGCDELITTESDTRPLHRLGVVRVVRFVG